MRIRSLSALAVAAIVAAGGCGSRDGSPPTGPASPPASAGRLDCTGRSPIAVVLISGLGVDPVTTWSGVERALGAGQEICRYVRPGLDDLPAVRPAQTAAVAAGELERLLRRELGGKGVVLVGASYGGYVARIVAGARRSVRGTVLVDSLHPDIDPEFERLFGADEARARATALARNPEGISFADLRASARQAARVATLGAMPLTVLVHSDSFDPGGKPVPKLERAWRRLQSELADLSSRSTLRVVPRSHHRIAEDRPDAVAAAIRATLRDAKSAE